ncbi:MAG: hypothetical protein QG639_429 [Patescibacteria group bacterium]|jgi:hypothetical protein|nr:hypothetical protein [Patescibacteria group bacterium]
MEPIKVSAVTELDQRQFPELPQFDRSNWILSLAGTKLKNTYKEAVAASLITCCVRSGEWKAIGVQMLYRVLLYHPVFQDDPQNTIHAVWDLLKEEKVQILQVSEQGEYLVPTPELARICLEDAVEKELV